MRGKYKVKVPHKDSQLVTWLEISGQPIELQNSTWNEMEMEYFCLSFPYAVPTDQTVLQVCHLATSAASGKAVFN